MKKAILVTIIVGSGIAAYGYYGLRTVEFVPDVTTVSVTEGDIVDTVGATGALEAVTTVQVGSQVSGIIQELLVDFNSIVREGDVIMRLDPSLFETQLAQARANLARAEAEVERLRVGVEDAATQLVRAEGLAARALISDTELDAARVAVRSAEAQLKSAEAQVTQAEASLSQNEVNLEHTVIRAPIDGIVTSRLVDVGQTVAASFQAPELFVIAADLTKMRVIANIDESDIGRIRPNQRVTFTVDAYPAEEFEGSVTQIRLEPIVTQNVVTYATVIDAPNPDLKLKPGMTATITLEIARRENILRIPNAALRFRPTPDVFAVLNQPVPPELQQGRSGDSLQASVAGDPSARPREFAGGLGAPGGSPGGLGGGRGGGPGGFGAGPGGFGAGPGGAPDPERRRQMMERIQQMSPEEREQFFAGMRARGGPGGGGPGGGRRGGAPRRLANAGGDTAIPAVERGATTIDALFSPLPPTVSNGRVWLLDGDRIAPVEVRLGVTDGTASELLGVRGGGADTPASARASSAAWVEDLRGLDGGGTARPDAGPTPGANGAPAAGRLALGTRLVTSVTTPEAGAPSSGGGGSPLIPQFPFGRRRR
ncbi:MAG: efflux RND transporter periplasmic adaptor subunit [Acidobacteria bacterium]|nr:efflux RND transporter periplasmic adaptor subunit [Acidobacteriota bacterium]